MRTLVLHKGRDGDVLLAVKFVTHDEPLAVFGQIPQHHVKLFFGDGRIVGKEGGA